MNSTLALQLRQASYHKLPRLTQIEKGRHKRRVDLPETESYEDILWVRLNQYEPGPDFPWRRSWINSSESIKTLWQRYALY